MTFVLSKSTIIVLQMFLAVMLVWMIIYFTKIFDSFWERITIYKTLRFLLFLVTMGLVISLFVLAGRDYVVNN